MKNTLLSSLILIFFTSCHDASYHFDKFINKGGKIETKIDSVQVFVKSNGKDSLIFVKAECPELQVPKTNIEVRQENKTKRKEIVSNTKLESLKLKNELKNLKEENKTLRTRIKFGAKENISKNKQDNKTKRVGERQEGKTQRKKYNIWWILFYILGIVTIPLFKFIKRFL